MFKYCPFNGVLYFLYFTGLFLDRILHVHETITLILMFFVLQLNRD